MKAMIRRLFRHAGYRLVTYGSITITMREMRRFRALSELYALIASVEGSVVECGVGKGRSFLYFAFLACEERSGRALWGFDSFQGFPTPSAQDASARAPKTGEWSGTSVGDITSVLGVAGIPASFVANSVHLIPGFFEHTLVQYDSNPIAFLHVDADLYQSYKEVLNALVPKVASGGVVLFDEYGEDAWVGATKAVDEFLAGTTWKLLQHATSGKYYFIKS